MARAPRFVFRGKRKQYLTSLKNHLRMVRDMDSREVNQAEMQERDADVFIDSVKLDKAFQTLWDQLDDCLSLKR